MKPRPLISLVRYDVFPDADASLRVMSERPHQLRLPTLNFHLVGVLPLPEDAPKPKRVIYANFRYVRGDGEESAEAATGWTEWA